MKPLVGKTSWRRERLPTSVFWLGEFHGLDSSRDHKETDITEQLSLHFTYYHYYCSRYHSGVFIHAISSSLSIPWHFLLLRAIFQPRAIFLTVLTHHNCSWMWVLIAVTVPSLFTLLAVFYAHLTYLYLYKDYKFIWELHSVLPTCLINLSIFLERDIQPKYIDFLLKGNTTTAQQNWEINWLQIPSYSLLWPAYQLVANR